MGAVAVAALPAVEAVPSHVPPLVGASTASALLRDEAAGEGTAAGGGGGAPAGSGHCAASAWRMDSRRDVTSARLGRDDASRL